MNLRPIALSLLASVMTMTHAHARPLLERTQIIDCFVVLGVTIVVLVIAAASQGSPSFPHVEPDPDAAEHHEREAALLRALKRRTDAQTELTASLIDKARIDAEYKELRQITDHDRVVRGLRRKL